MKSSRGFSLIEVVITVSIMSVITLLSATALRNAVKAKTKIQDQIDTISPIRDVMRLMRSDIVQAFHYRDIELEAAKVGAEEKKKTAKTGEKKETDPEKEATERSAEKQSDLPDYLKSENRVDPTTHFIAKETEMNFVTFNSFRILKDSPQPEFGEVGYYVDSCKNRPNKSASSGKCLYRRFSALVDTDVTVGGSSTQLLRDIEDFELKYYSAAKRDWVAEWNSQSGDEILKDSYPEAIEISFTVRSEDENTKKIKSVSMQMVVPIGFSNNEVKESAPEATSEMIPPDEGGGDAPDE